jgi:hypothetical protein
MTDARLCLLGAAAAIFLAVTEPTVVLPAGAAASGSKNPMYTIKRGSHRNIARFRVAYTGAGGYATTYHSEPPNPGGQHDTNDARDSSTQKWALTFVHNAIVPACGRLRPRAADPCLKIRGLLGATGLNQAAGHVNHRHTDGVFPAQNRSISCDLSAATPAGRRLGAAVRLRYLRRPRAIGITALIPVADALSMLPGACPAQGDSLDGLFDNYFVPGFSFAAGYGPSRWFQSAEVIIPASAFHKAARIRIPLRLTHRGAPPRGCAVIHPAYERCTTGGAWSGVLVLTAAG